MIIDQDNKILVALGLLLASIWFMVIIKAIDQMEARENEAKAIARIYTPAGCVVSTEVVSLLKEKYVFLCDDTYHVVNLGK